MKKSLLFLFILTLLTCSDASAQSRVVVKGHIYAVEDGQPLIGATVFEDGTANGVSTGADGSYSIRVAPGATLVFGYMGFVSQNYQATLPSDGSNPSELLFDAYLETDAQAIEEVVVVAYGTRRKGTITGSLTTIGADKIGNVPSASFDQALQGQTPGLTILSNSGAPNAVAEFQIRGTNSINSGTSPLFIMDGMPINQSDFTSLSPNDIESVTVLKDASATSIYGARAANGVVVITTKRGKIGDKGQVLFSAQYGFANLAYGKWDMMNTSERLQYEQELGILGNKNIAQLSQTDIDWRKMVYRDNAPTQRYEIAASGARISTTTSPVDTREPTVSLPLPIMKDGPFVPTSKHGSING